MRRDLPTRPWRRQKAIFNGIRSSKRADRWGIGTDGTTTSGHERSMVRLRCSELPGKRSADQLRYRSWFTCLARLGRISKDGVVISPEQGKKVRQDESRTHRNTVQVTAKHQGRPGRLFTWHAEIFSLPLCYRAPELWSLLINEIPRTAVAIMQP